METVYYIGLINTWVISLDSMCDAKTLELVKDNFKSRNDIGDAHVVVTGGKFVPTENKIDLMHESKKYDAIQNYEEVKLAMNSELTDEQILAAGKAIKQAVMNNQCFAYVDLIGFTSSQANVLLRLTKSHGYSDCKIMANGNVPNYMIIQLNTSNFRSKE
ncbi:hypothetical protein ACEPPO_00815 (plasmid) [Limosilactobacillus fermentum]